MFKLITRFVRCVMGDCEREITAVNKQNKTLSTVNAERFKKIDSLQRQVDNYSNLIEANQREGDMVSDIENLNKHIKKLSFKVDNLQNGLSNYDIENQMYYKQMLNDADEKANPKPPKKAEKIEEEIENIDDTIKKLGNLLPQQ